MAAYLPDNAGGLLPYWQLLVAVTASFNTLQSVSTTKLTKRVYANAAVTSLQSRTFGIWTVTSAAIRLAAAYDIANPAVYRLAFASYIFAFLHFMSEFLVFGTIKLNGGSISPMIVSNPADLNVIQGSYPERPKPRDYLTKDSSKPVFIGGNEGLAVVDHVPEGSETQLKEGDWVIMGKPQLGTWTSHSNIPSSSLFPIPSSGLSEIHAATLQVNPATAYRMLKDFEALKDGDWVIQNGGNSQVGLGVIQLAKQWGLRSINFVRDRDNMDELRRDLQNLGADHVFTYSELADKSFRSKLAVLTSEAPLRLGLNCVGGKDTSTMAKLLSKDSTLVTYGAMSMQPLSLPSSLFIFKGLKSLGFWMTTWYARCNVDERRAMTDELVKLMKDGALKEPETEIVDLKGNDDEMGRIAREAIKSVKGKKVVFKFADT